jgi:hypothetical protein
VHSLAAPIAVPNPVADCRLNVTDNPRPAGHERCGASLPGTMESGRMQETTQTGFDGPPRSWNGAGPNASNSRASVESGTRLPAGATSACHPYAGGSWRAVFSFMAVTAREAWSQRNGRVSGVVLMRHSIVLCASAGPPAGLEWRQSGSGSSNFGCAANLDSGPFAPL